MYFKESILSTHWDKKQASKQACEQSTDGKAKSLPERTNSSKGPNKVNDTGRIKQPTNGIIHLDLT